MGRGKQLFWFFSFGCSVGKKSNVLFVRLVFRYETQLVYKDVKYIFTQPYWNKTNENRYRLIILFKSDYYRLKMSFEIAYLPQNANDEYPLFGRFVKNCVCLRVVSSK